jgi:hypothetical protein
MLSNIAAQPCGRRLLKVASLSGGVVDYGPGALGMAQQENMIKRMISVEGNAGWTDRLSELMFYDVGLLGVQEHSCRECFEYHVKPCVNYIPVFNNFDIIVVRLKRAE